MLVGCPKVGGESCSEHNLQPTAANEGSRLFQNLRNRLRDYTVSQHKNSQYKYSSLLKCPNVTERTPTLGYHKHGHRNLSRYGRH